MWMHCHCIATSRGIRERAKSTEDICYFLVGKIEENARSTLLLFGHLLLAINVKSGASDVSSSVKDKVGKSTGRDYERKLGFERLMLALVFVEMLKDLVAGFGFDSSSGAFSALNNVVGVAGVQRCPTSVNDVEGPHNIPGTTSQNKGISNDLHSQTWMVLKGRKESQYSELGLESRPYDASDLPLFWLLHLADSCFAASSSKTFASPLTIRRSAPLFLVDSVKSAVCLSVVLFVGSPETLRQYKVVLQSSSSLRYPSRILLVKFISYGRSIHSYPKAGSASAILGTLQDMLEVLHLQPPDKHRPKRIPFSPAKGLRQPLARALAQTARTVDHRLRPHVVCCRGASSHVAQLKWHEVFIHNNMFSELLSHEHRTYSGDMATLETLMFVQFAGHVPACWNYIGSAWTYCISYRGLCVPLSIPTPTKSVAT
ncbi:hypothetical protein NEOLEDRAFT_1148125 [Neolentinus lepideus HHB14362 ss-1]|uniref:Uncharacterized protein n=1 Tax=Neolentinus lepideus HHB14362 ss-1 TaxID=1314782 RepID=A0A165SHT1_9AGAM|nr:hypothetical protein NEOLEDRAFT_1148125 [Neolentinus lepideus HHB14362 ss-1]